MIAAVSQEVVLRVAPRFGFDVLPVREGMWPKLTHRETAIDVDFMPAAECWAYFLRYAEQLTQREISGLFPDQEILEAAGVLEMIAQTPEQRLLYNARLKLRRDEESRPRGARQEGIPEGRKSDRIWNRTGSTSGTDVRKKIRKEG